MQKQLDHLSMTNLDEIGAGQIDIKTSDGETIVVVLDNDSHDVEATARLIAAAPELLQAAKDALREADWWIRAKTWEDDESFERNLQKLDSVRAAIAKAEA